MAIVFFNIVPENDRIQPLDHDIANQTVVVKGYVTLCVSKSVSIGQIRVQIKGVLRSLVSSGLADKIVGLYESTQVLVRKRRELLDKITRLEPGAHRWPFEIAIDSSKLPDSLDIPHHKITYELSAKLIPSSLTEKVKIGYWEARRRTSSSSNDLTQDVPNAIDSNAQPTTNQWLRTKHRLQVQKHSDNLCGFIDDVPWTKYEGERQGHLSYQVILPSVVYPQTPIEIQCSLKPMREEAQVVLVTIAFEQTERYPVHPGEYGPDQSFEDISMRTRTRKIAEIERTILPSESLENLSFSIDFDSSKVSCQLSTPGLVINHLLRLRVHFVRTGMAKLMSLSFPIKVATMSPGAVGSTEYMLQEDEGLPSYEQVLQEGSPPSHTTETHVPSVRIPAPVHVEPLMGAFNNNHSQIAFQAITITF